jgi:TctA family transporter
MGLFKKKSGGLTGFGKMFVSKKDPSKPSVFGKILNGASTVVSFVPGVGSAIGGVLSLGTNLAIAQGSKVAIQKQERDMLQQQKEQEQKDLINNALILKNAQQIAMQPTQNVSTGVFSQFQETQPKKSKGFFDWLFDWF